MAKTISTPPDEPEGTDTASTSLPIASRALFDSSAWTYAQVDEHENVSTVELQNPAKGVRYKESVRWKPDGYEASASYEIALPLGKRRAKVIERWLKKVAALHEPYGITTDAVCIPYDDDLNKYVLPVRIAIDGRSNLKGHTVWNADFSLGGALSGRFQAGALNDSAKFTADLTRAPVFFARDCQEDPVAKPKIFSLSRGRYGTQAAVSFWQDGRFCSEGLDFSGRTVPPRGEVPLRLAFPSGTLAVPMDDEERQALAWVEGHLAAFIRDAPYVAEIASFASAKNKYLCVRHALQVCGAGVLCILGVIAGGGLTVGTGGITVGAFLLLAALCLGAQSLLLLDEILAHAGFA